jgi:hypothetical protein
MSGALKKYVEWLNRGRKTGRIAYVTSAWNVPEPTTGAEWQIDEAFNAAEELQRNPTFKAVFNSAIDNGLAVIASEAR